MANTVKLNELQSTLSTLEYPTDRMTVREELADVVLIYADGEEPLTEVLTRIEDETFESADDLSTEIYNALPVEAVGEPGQSEGEG